MFIIMDQSPQKMVVRTEREENMSMATAVFSGTGALALQISELIANQGIKVSWAKSIEELASILEAKYLFLFLDEAKIENEGEVFLKKLATTAIRHTSNLVVVFEQVSLDSLQKTERLFSEIGVNPSVVEVRSKIETLDLQQEVAGKVVRMALSFRPGERLVVGDFSKEILKPTFTETQSGVVVTKKENKKKKAINRGARDLAWLLIFVVILTLPLFFAGIYTLNASLELWSAKTAISRGEFLKARKSAESARDQFTTMKDVCVSVAFFDKLDSICGGFSGLALTADTAYRGAGLQGQLLNLSRAFFSPDGQAPDLQTFSESAAVDSGVIEENLGFMEAIIAKDYQYIAPIAERFGFNRTRLGKYLAQLPKMRFLARAGRELSPVVPQVLGVSDSTLTESKKRTYLLVFQNSAELRGGGGFIGSYAIVHVDNGRLLDFKINDIYSVDGQLKGRIVPPDEILHYLGQPAWFMRDANFSPDFPLSAKRLAWFLEKETNQRVDGVIAINIGAVEKIIEAMGEVKIQSSDESITAKNFFQKAEYASEINFFPGSTQKRDFLGEVAEAILGRITSEQNLSYDGLAKGFSDALQEKDIMLYFTSTAVQSAAEDSEFAGSIFPDHCSSGQNCFMAVEDNFGANKANYFVKKKMKVDSTIDKGGGVTNTVSLTFDNQSPNDSWPGGKYKNYLRLLVPHQAKMLSLDIGDDRKASVSSILTADVLSKVAPKEFLVYKSNEQVLRSDSASSSGYTSFGMLVEVPVKTKKTVVFKYIMPNQLDFSKSEDKYSFTILKQSGSTFDPLNVIIGYPTFLKPNIDTSPFVPSPIVYPQELIYNTVLDTDKTFEVKFKQN